MKHLLMAAVVACLAVPAWAQRQCFPRPDVVDTLNNKYGEAVAAEGMDDRGLAAELWVNAETGTWTFTLTTPNGYTCLEGSGSEFQAVTAAPNTDDPA